MTEMSTCSLLSQVENEPKEKGTKNEQKKRNFLFSFHEKKSRSLRIRRPRGVACAHVFYFSASLTFQCLRRLLPAELPTSLRLSPLAQSPPLCLKGCEGVREAERGLLIAGLIEHNWVHRGTLDQRRGESSGNFNEYQQKIPIALIEIQNFRNFSHKKLVWDPKATKIRVFGYVDSVKNSKKWQRAQKS